MIRTCLAVLAVVLALVGCKEPSASTPAAGGEASGTGSAPPAPTLPPVPRPVGIDRGCETAADCEAVGCECACSGVGVSLREDVVDRKDAERWYKDRGCAKPGRCLQAACPISKVDCVGGVCHVVYGAAEDSHRTGP
jgi:hypothetical protein